MNDINFIKWLVGYVNQWVFMEYAPDDIEIHTPWNVNGEPFTDFENEKWHNIYYPLLLQRAVFGWNRSGTPYTIEIERYKIYCIYKNHEVNMSTEDDLTPDKAYETILKYIYSQEIK